MEIFYFSGTGNSLHVARELQSRLPGAELIPVMGVLEKRKIRAKAGTTGIIFPIHALTFPWPVKKFLKKIDLALSTYIFAIATRECFTKVFTDINKLLAVQNKSLDAYFSIEMPQNYIPIFKIYSGEQFNKVELEMKKKLDYIKKIIAHKEPEQPKDPGKWLFFSHILYPLFTLYYQKIRFKNMEKAFYTDLKCNGCGMCEKICLSGKIKIIENRPKWDTQVKCTYCFACLHYCPVRAIQIKGRKTTKKGRYHHPSIKANDIIKQKNIMD
jgi:ferredoxin